MELNEIFVQRILHWSSNQLVIQISVPMPEDAQPDWPGNRLPTWYCWVSINMIPGKRVYRERVIGIDGWQSLEEAMSLAQKAIKKKYPDAYAFEPGDGPFFAFMVLEDLPHGYSQKLRSHLETECVRKKEELSKELRKIKGDGKSKETGKVFPAEN